MEFDKEFDILVRLARNLFELLHNDCGTKEQSVVNATRVTLQQEYEGLKQKIGGKTGGLKFTLKYDLLTCKRKMAHHMKKLDLTGTIQRRERSNEEFDTIVSAHGKVTVLLHFLEWVISYLHTKKLLPEERLGVDVLSQLESETKLCILHTFPPASHRTGSSGDITHPYVEELSEDSSSTVSQCNHFILLFMSDVNQKIRDMLGLTHFCSLYEVATQLGLFDPPKQLSVIHHQAIFALHTSPTWTIDDFLQKISYEVGQKIDKVYTRVYGDYFLVLNATQLHSLPVVYTTPPSSPPESKVSPSLSKEVAATLLTHLANRKSAFSPEEYKCLKLKAMQGDEGLVACFSAFQNDEEEFIDSAKLLCQL